MNCTVLSNTYINVYSILVKCNYEKRVKRKKKASRKLEILTPVLYPIPEDQSKRPILMSNLLYRSKEYCKNILYFTLRGIGNEIFILISVPRYNLHEVSNKGGNLAF